VSLAAEYQTAETLGANRGDIPATGTRSDESSNRAGSLPLASPAHLFTKLRGEKMTNWSVCLNYSSIL
jgi:hypothetical protein